MLQEQSLVDERIPRQLSAEHVYFRSFPLNLFYNLQTTTPLLRATEFIGNLFEYGLEAYDVMLTAKTHKTYQELQLRRAIKVGKLRNMASQVV